MNSPLNKPIKPPREQVLAAQQRRAAVMAVIYGAGAKGITVNGVAQAVGMPPATVSHMLAKLRGADLVLAVSQGHNIPMRLYAPEFAPAEPSKDDAPLPVAGPRTFHPFAEKATYSAAGLQPVRMGAQDHLAVPSRRGDNRVAHRPMMCMGSNIGGGV